MSNWSYADESVLRIGSKRFTESYILGEVLAATAQPTRAVHRRGLGNTAIVFEALKAGSIDLYPEYTGTIDAEILKSAAPTTLVAMNAALAPLGMGVAAPLGFNNTYALAMRAADAETRAIRTVSDLRKHADLRFGLSHEFLGRADGWPGLVQRYNLSQRPTGLDHGLAYDALANKQIDVIDSYSTDAKIAKFGLRVLSDDLGHFPKYDAVLLYRLDVPQRFPTAWRALIGLEGRIPPATMIALNAAVELDGKSFGDVARTFVAGDFARAASVQTSRASFWNRLFADDFWRLTGQHVLLVVLAVAAATAIGVPLGIAAAFMPRARQWILGFVSVVQTIPSLALLAMLIPLLGMIGTVPALVALFAYGLLPIVRNTCTGLEQVPASQRLAATALGLRSFHRVRYIDLPIAAPIILAGIKTAAIISVGTATIAAFIGAGGYGERIATGLALNDNQLLLAGAIPAAALAILTQLGFELLERLLARKRGR